jgi:hypothetical protein
MARRDSQEAKREYNRQRYWRDRERILAQQKERYERQKDEIKEKNLDYYQNNKEKIKTRAAAHYKANAETIKKREALRRRDKKIAAVDLLGGQCSRCPQNHPAALDFHHKNQEDKLFSIGDMIMSTRRVPQDVLETEILKCELLCKNCHAIEHCTWGE